MGKLVELPTTTCEGCGAASACATMTSLGSSETGYEELCARCFNDRCAERMGLHEFEHADFEPMVFKDFAGREHTFVFNLRLFPTGLGLYSFEYVSDDREGYEFAVSGDFFDPPTDLFEDLCAKICRNLATQSTLYELIPEIINQGGDTRLFGNMCRNMFRTLSRLQSHTYEELGRRLG